MSFAKLTSTKDFIAFGLLEVGEFFQYSSRAYIKISANNAINLLKQGEVDYFESGQEVENAEIELKLL